jgi:hypothetical protein
MEVQSPLKNDGGRKKVIEDEKERGASRHLNLQEVDGQHSYPRKRKSKVASTATLTPGLDLPPGAMLALVPVGLVNSLVSKLDGGADSSSASMLETLKK